MNINFLANIFFMIILRITRQTIFVDNNNNSTIQNGSENYPFKTIDQIWQSKISLAPLEIILFDSNQTYNLNRRDFSSCKIVLG